MKKFLINLLGSLLVFGGVCLLILSISFIILLIPVIGILQFFGVKEFKVSKNQIKCGRWVKMDMRD